GQTRWALIGEWHFGQFTNVAPRSFQCARRVAPLIFERRCFWIPITIPPLIIATTGAMGPGYQACIKEVTGCPVPWYLGRLVASYAAAPGVDPRHPAGSRTPPRHLPQTIGAVVVNRPRK